MIANIEVYNLALLIFPVLRDSKWGDPAVLNRDMLANMTLEDSDSLLAARLFNRLFVLSSFLGFPVGNFVVKLLLKACCSLVERLVDRILVKVCNVSRCNWPIVYHFMLFSDSVNNSLGRHPAEL